MQEVAGKILTRIRVNKMRAAARFAGKVAMSAKKAQGEDDDDLDFDELPGQVPASAS